MRKRTSTALSALLLTVSLMMSACGQNMDTLGAASGSVETEDQTGNESKDAVTYEASGDNEHALAADGETLSYDNIIVNKTGNGDGDEADFYGENAAAFATNGADLTIRNATITSDGSHANAVFSYGEGTKLTISDSEIHTKSNNSGGIMVTGGGTLNADNLTVDTKGGSSAPIRSDRGGGTMNVTGGSYSSYGKGSPAIYSTANINVSNATLYSDISEGVVVEGANSVTLNDVNITAKHTEHNSDKSDHFQAVMIYQSMSGDADEGTASFNMKGGSLTSQNGGLFFVNNTVATIGLEAVKMTNASDDLLTVAAAGWGKEGANGGQVTLNATEQDLDGVITVDDISTLNLLLGKDSNFSGSVDGKGEVYVELKDGAKWVLTGDSAISSLTCDADSVDLNGFTLTVGGKEYEAGTASEGTKIEVKETRGKGTRPEKPDGDAAGKPDGGPDGNPPERQGGNPPDGNPPEKPEGAPDGNPPAKPSGNPPAKPGESE
ncbi:MAG: hypothetical protein K5641_04000 [Lachnospiraceae bacterium]|nr:hypothetical protein [Lachnospiraceae bacterium]